MAKLPEDIDEGEYCPVPGSRPGKRVLARVTGFYLIAPTPKPKIRVQGLGPSVPVFKLMDLATPSSF